jgi:hypothetical protein
MADNELTVDEFVNTKVLPQFRPVVEMLRKLMREHVPDAREEIRYGIPNYTRNKGLAVISPTKKDITFAFSRGASFEDRYHLLQGVGHVSKHIKLRSVDDVAEEVLIYYVDQALKFDS